jgi:L-lysine 2,3-aminomutase
MLDKSVLRKNIENLLIQILKQEELNDLLISGGDVTPPSKHG